MDPVRASNLPTCGRLRRPHPQGGEAGRPAGAGAAKIRFAVQWGANCPHLLATSEASLFYLRPGQGHQQLIAARCPLPPQENLDRPRWLAVVGTTPCGPPAHETRERHAPPRSRRRCDLTQRPPTPHAAADIRGNRPARGGRHRFPLRGHRTGARATPRSLAKPERDPTRGGAARPQGCGRYATGATG